MRVSIKDIALKCNLSVSTVSRALNGDYGVKSATRTSVMKVAKELGYVPNIAAKELVSQKSKLIGIILNESDGDGEARPAFFELLPHINKTLAIFNYRAIIYTINSNSYIRGEITDIINLRNLSGCIVVSVFRENHPIYEDIKSLNNPIVVLESSILTRICSNINTDEVMGGYMATRYLIDNGHKQIGFVNGPQNFEISNERFEGFQKAIEESQLQISDTAIIWSNYTGSGGKDSIHQLIQNNPAITAVFFANDLMAMGAISSMAESGILVPKDISIIGYDGLFVCKYYNPPLASVVIDNAAIGVRAAELLLELINGGSGKTVRVMPKLFEGKSVRKY
ncbi:LacI family DNA-binding transcriptional regulator [Paenibacillus qinlingensis]|uniref:LacI family transcriptional regulator n=1 Tax=Paenibacillus qinlingensis TaxID=1837343 RepID=A0ABU1NSJ7_9BACL|nr:LacI family DNA-binding transcriptional regulator [Paenibacillus qinlingensis]MDR6550458.1 LacI family transcriptional regulator [Paenibacillus qinlingensis]